MLYGETIAVSSEIHMQHTNTLRDQKVGFLAARSQNCEKRLLTSYLSVCLHGTTRLPMDEFSWNLILGIFRKYFEKIQVSLKSDKNNGYFTWKPLYIFDHISLSSS
jgi:hypothetical protein